MFLISIVLSVGLTTIFAESIFPNINGEIPKFDPQQEPSTTQGNQVYSPSMPQLPMEGNQPIYPMPQQQMMQGFQPPLSFNPINPQQLSLLLMSTYGRLMALTQLLSMQNKYQYYQPNPYSDPAINNYGPTPAPIPYAQQPFNNNQVDLQNKLRNEMLQQQQQQAESQRQAILEERRIQREYDIELEKRERIMKRQAEEAEIEKQQKEVERQLRDEAEIQREREEAEKQIIEEEKKEMEEKINDIKLVQEEELRFKKNEEEKKKQKVRTAKRPRKQISPTKK